MNITQKGIVYYSHSIVGFSGASCVAERVRKYGISSAQRTTEAQTIEATLRSEISQNVVYNHAFDLLGSRLERVVAAYEMGEITVAQKISKLYDIGNDIDRVYARMEQLGLDVVQFAVSTICQDSQWITDIVPGGARRFASQIVEYMYDTLPVGWRHAEKCGEYVLDISSYVEYLFDNAYSEQIEIDNWSGFIDALQRIILKGNDMKSTERE